MPTYEYECLSCKHKFEILQSITAKPKTKCPECGEKLKKLISGSVGFIFKGAGFYATDYKKAGKPSNTAPITVCPKAMASATAQRRAPASPIRPGDGDQTMALRPKDGCIGCPGH